MCFTTWQLCSVLLKIHFILYFNTEHERKLQVTREEHAHELEAERARTADVGLKVAALEERLRETMEALEAASRLSIAIDQKEFQINQLKREGEPTAAITIYLNFLLIN